MEQLYLFIGDENKETVQTYEAPSKAEVKIQSIKNSNCWLYQISIPDEIEGIADVLSVFHDNFTSLFSPVILVNGSSAYYNERLYPLFNEFERKLRELLYLASSLSEETDQQSSLKNLEEKQLREIFEMLFYDHQFESAVRAHINNNKHYTQEELVNDIKSFSEEVTWDKLIGKEYVKTLRKNFLIVQKYRNDVMHAHNVNTDQYREAKVLIETINAELDEAIQAHIIAIEEKEPSKVILPHFNRSLNNALDQIEGLVNVFSGLNDIAEQVGTWVTSPEAVNYLNAARAVACNFDPEFLKSISEIQKTWNSMFPREDDD